MTDTKSDVFQPTDAFTRRHIGPSEHEMRDMLELLGYATLDDLIDAVVPERIRLRRPLALDGARSEAETLEELRSMAGENRVYRSFIGMG